MRARGLLTGALAAALAAACAPAPPPAAEAKSEPLSVAELLGPAAAEGFARALEPRPFAFPADHGPHPAFRTEWWYLTGNLHADGGRPFGYQLTFFRQALAASPPERSSPWAARDTYLAHFTVSDLRGGDFHSFERFARGAAGLAGARGEPLRVWLEEWSLAAAGDGPHRFSLAAAEGEVALELELESLKPPVLQGERGLSRKGREPGNASYYYSLTRLASRGRLRLAGRTFAVDGASWMDREWSTSALEADQVGWDWFSLQLSDGSEVMYYQLRRADGSAHPLSSGTLVAPDGAAQGLGESEVRLEVLGRWRSPDGADYPAGWRLRAPGRGLDLEITPRLADQELRHAFRYWEGAVRARGERAGKSVDGQGYVELTGYAAY